jgi:hypothetical protein
MSCRVKPLLLNQIKSSLTKCIRWRQTSAWRINETRHIRLMNELETFLFKFTREVIMQICTQFTNVHLRIQSH